jgi:hypothetical protein
VVHVDAVEEVQFFFWHRDLYLKNFFIFLKKVDDW